MFVGAVLSFVAGIYLQTIYSFSLKTLLISIAISLLIITLCLGRKKHVSALLLMLLCFFLAGMMRLAPVQTLMHGGMEMQEGKGIYEGLIIEASPNTKILQICKPEYLRNVKVVFRTSGMLNINDRIRVFGEMMELTATYKNPYVTSWKWLKRLEGVSYELRGTLVSSVPGKRGIHAWRDFLGKRIEASNAQYAGVIKALTIGDTTGLDEATKTLFLRTGTSHILAISGSNIGIVAAFFFFIARELLRRVHKWRLRGDDTRYAALLTIPFAVLFMLIAGSSIPTIRATIMITVYMLALFFERNKHVIHTIALSALVILLVYPHSLFSPSFQLTFTSILFIVLFGERFSFLMNIENRAIKWLILSVFMTLSATLGTFPLVLYHFYGINPFSVIHNLIAVPLMCVIAMPLSLVGMLLPYGDYLLRLSGEVLRINMRILEYLNVGYIYPVIRPTLFEVIAYFACISTLVCIRKRSVLALSISVILLFFAGYSYVAYEQRFNNKDLCVNFIDVGLGDAILIEAPKGMRMLIDGGGQLRGDYDVGKSILTPILLSRKILTLDYIVNTHPHDDHIGGLSYVMQHFKVRHFASGAYFFRQEKFVEILKLVKEKNISFHQWKRGDTLILDKGMEVRVLSPAPDIPLDNLNNASLVLKITHGRNSFLLTGDIDTNVEDQLVLLGEPLRSNVLKIPHHGSKNSSSAAFVRTVKPDIAVLSVGRGIKGLPANEALERYKRLTIPILRTDKDGFVRICSDGDRIRCHVFLGGDRE